MAVRYIGTSISGIASDTKPTPTANEMGVLFVETDTNKLYQWDTDSWNEVNPPTVLVTDNESTSENNLIPFIEEQFTILPLEFSNMIVISFFIHNHVP